MMICSPPAESSGGGLMHGEQLVASADLTQALKVWDVGNLISPRWEGGGGGAVVESR